MVKLSRLLLAVAPLPVVLVVSCASSANRPRVSAGTAKDHWVYALRLEGFVRELPDQKSVRPSAGEQAGSGRGEQGDSPEVAALADHLARAALQLPSAIADAGFTEADYRGFLAQVDTLRDQALALRDEAITGDWDGASGAFDRIKTTCRACHLRFPDVAAPLSRAREKS